MICPTATCIKFDEAELTKTFLTSVSLFIAVLARLVCCTCKRLHAMTWVQMVSDSPTTNCYLGKKLVLLGAPQMHEYPGLPAHRSAEGLQTGGLLHAAHSSIEESTDIGSKSSGEARCHSRDEHVVSLI